MTQDHNLPTKRTGTEILYECGTCKKLFSKKSSLAIHNTLMHKKTNNLESKHSSTNVHSENIDIGPDFNSSAVGTTVSVLDKSEYNNTTKTTTTTTQNTQTTFRVYTQSTVDQMISKATYNLQKNLSETKERCEQMEKSNLEYAAKVGLLTEKLNDMHTKIEQFLKTPGVIENFLRGFSTSLSVSNELPASNPTLVTKESTVIPITENLIPHPSSFGKVPVLIPGKLSQMEQLTSPTTTMATMSRKLSQSPPEETTESQVEQTTSCTKTSPITSTSRKVS